LRMECVGANPKAAASKEAPETDKTDIHFFTIFSI